MRNHPDDRNAYANLKKHLAQRFQNDMTSYCFGKDEFVALIDEKAGWRGIRIVKALTEKEWNTIKTFRQEYYFNKFQSLDPYTSTFNHQSHTHLVAYQKTNTIGYAQIQCYLSNKAVIRFIIIDESKRNQGFGSQFLILYQAVIF